MAIDSVRDELVRELEEDGDSFFTAGRWSNITDILLMVVTVLASLIATVLAATEITQHRHWIIAGVAAIPAAATSLQRIIGIRERAYWYFLYAAHVRSLATRLKYADAPSIEEFAKKRAELEIEMEMMWIKAARPEATLSGKSGSPVSQRSGRQPEIG